MGTKLVKVLAWAALAVQAVLCLRFFVMGLRWGGVWWVLGVAQAVLILTVMLVAIVRGRPLLAVPLPAAVPTAVVLLGDVNGYLLPRRASSCGRTWPDPWLRNA